MGGNIGKPVKPGKKILAVCKRLGNKYSVRRIDFENVIYRDLGNGFDLEISGIDRSRKQTCTIFLWRVSPYQHVEAVWAGVDLFDIAQVSENLRLMSVGILYEEEQKNKQNGADIACKEEDNEKK